MPRIYTVRKDCYSEDNNFMGSHILELEESELNDMAQCETHKNSHVGEYVILSIEDSE